MLSPSPTGSTALFSYKQIHTAHGFLLCRIMIKQNKKRLRDFVVSPSTNCFPTTSRLPFPMKTVVSIGSLCGRTGNSDLLIKHQLRRFSPVQKYRSTLVVIFSSALVPPADSGDLSNFELLLVSACSGKSFLATMLTWFPSALHQAPVLILLSL